MRKIIFILAVFFVSCKYEPTVEFYINGKPYYTVKKCIKEELKLQAYGPRFAMECVEWKMDTVELKK